jgi:LacI family transcriptional regulator
MSSPAATLGWSPRWPAVWPRSAGVLGDPDLMRYGEPPTMTGVWAGRELFDLRPRPSAVVCFNDKVAVGVMEVAAARGLRVPEDLSVTGFDGIDVSRATTSRLTTVRQPLQEMGRTASRC